MDLVETLKYYIAAQFLGEIKPPIGFVDPSKDNICLADAALSGPSIKSVNSSTSLIAKGVLINALLEAGYAKLRGRSPLPFWNSYFCVFIPSAICPVLPSLVVKALFFAGKRVLCHENDRKYPLTVNHSKRLERTLYIVATVALSTFLMPRLYARLTNQPFTLSDQVLKKIFTVQLIWHVVIAETLAFCAKQMRKEIKQEPTKWLEYFKSNFIFKQCYSFGNLGYGLERALIKKLTVTDLGVTTDSENSWEALIKKLTVNDLGVTTDSENSWEAFYKTYQGDFQSVSEKKDAQGHPKYPNVVEVIEQLKPKDELTLFLLCDKKRLINTLL